MELELAKRARPITLRTRPFYLRLGLLAGVFLGLLYYLLAMQWEVVELLRTLAGAAALWLPVGALIYLLLRHEVGDRTTRVTLSAIASYTLTTLAYFACSVLELAPLFPVGQAALLVGVAVYWGRTRGWTAIARSRLQWPRVDWILVALIVASLGPNITYQTAYEVAPQTGERTFVVNNDQTYFTGQAYELARHVPPLQQANQAGLPERAYHMFPHLTTMLLARYTGQGDMLRAHLAYHYTALEILMALALYCMVSTLLRSRWAGYVGASLLYILAVYTPPLLPNTHPFFFFTLYPHVSSALDPVAISSPQMYSGLLVMYGILLSSLLISGRFHRGQTVDRLVMLVGLMVGAMIRFRIQIFLPLLPGFLLLTGYMWWRSRRNAYAIGAGLALGAAVLSYLEMQRPVYLPNTAKLFIGYNGLTSRSSHFINGWPFSAELRAGLDRVMHDPTLFNWTWQVVSMSAFVALNMLGIPLLLAIVLYLRSKRAWREWRLFTLLSIWMLVSSTAGAMLLTTSYDAYSVGGQMLLHTYWYMFPLLSIALWALYQALQARLRWPRSSWVIIWLVAMVTSLIGQQLRGPTPLAEKTRNAAVTFGENEWLALSFVHDRTPQSSVIIYKRRQKHYSNYVVFGGIAGRATYFELPGSSIRDLPSGQGSPEDRRRRIENLWAATSPQDFCALLTPTVATHLVEYADQPLQVSRPPCLQEVWASPGQSDKVTVWQITR